MKIDKEKSKAMLARGVGMLETLDYIRAKTGNPSFGMELETGMLNAALADIARQTAFDEVDQYFKKVRGGE